jgi:hypothetical protein
MLSYQENNSFMDSEFLKLERFNKGLSKPNNKIGKGMKW